MSKEYKNIDDLFRDKFEHFEVDPPEHVWTNIQSGISGHNPKGPGSGLNTGGIAGITLLIAVVGVLGLLFINNTFVVSEEVEYEPGIQEEVPANELLAEIQTNGSDDQILPETDPLEVSTPPTELKKQESSVVEEITEPTGEKKRKRSKVKSNNPKRNSTVYINPTLPETIPQERVSHSTLAVLPIAASSIVLQESASTQSPEMPTSMPAYADNPPAASISEETTYNAADVVRGQQIPKPVEQRKHSNKNDYGQFNKWALGVYFTPEMIVYPSDDQLKNYSYSLDLHATLRPGNYFFQSGLGVARNQEQGNTMINYNEYLGSYEDVYNVTFDSTNSGVVPVYHTETVSVYDTIDHIVISPTKRYYTYLQVPLFVGYGVESKRFGWFVKGGPSISFLIHEDQESTDMNSMSARILNVENELPGRISTNWQFILTAGATYKLGNRVSISLEPMFRYYIQSVYEQDKLNTKHPYSIGLRSGFQINF